MSTKQTNIKNKKKQTTSTAKKTTTTKTKVAAKETQKPKTVESKPKKAAKTKTNTNTKATTKPKITPKKQASPQTATKKASDKKTKVESVKATKTPLHKKIETSTNNNELVRLVKIIVIITVIMALIYVVTMIATKKADEVKKDDTSTSKKTTKTEIQYDNIMIGTMLNKSGTYYVLIEEDKKDDQRIGEYDQLVTTIKNKEGAIKIYKVDLTDAFNKVYKAKESNYYVDNISDFKVTGTTLLKIEDAKVVTAFDDYDGIKNELNNLK